MTTMYATQRAAAAASARPWSAFHHGAEAKASQVNASVAMFARSMCAVDHTTTAATKRPARHLGGNPT